VTRNINKAVCIVLGTRSIMNVYMLRINITQFGQTEEIDGDERAGIDK